MKSIIDRLEHFMEKEGLNNNQVTVRAKLSNGQIGKARKQKNGLNSQTIEKILRAFPELSPEWFVLGDGSMYRSKEKQLQATSGTTKDLKELITGIVDYLEQNNQETNKLSQMVKEKLQGI